MRQECTRTTKHLMVLCVIKCLGFFCMHSFQSSLPHASGIRFQNFPDKTVREKYFITTQYLVISFFKFNKCGEPKFHMIDLSPNWKKFQKKLYCEINKDHALLGHINKSCTISKCVESWLAICNNIIGQVADHNRTVKLHMKNKS